MALLVSIEEMKTWMRSEIPTVDDPYLQQAIESATQTMGNACHRQWIVATTSTARSFQPRGCSRRLPIDDCTQITSVVDNGVTLTSGTDYQPEPLNQLSNAGETVPYDSLVKPYNPWYSNNNLASVVVTAKWGWAAIPSQVITSIKIIAKDEFNQRDSGVGFGLVAVSDAGGVGSRENMIVRKAVADYYNASKIGVA